MRTVKLTAIIAILLVTVSYSQQAIIVFSADSTGNYEIYRMNADGSNVIRITDNMADDVEPAISPCGRWLAWSSNRDGDYEIYYIHIDSSEVSGTSPQQLTNTGDDEQKPDWSPAFWKISNRYSICYEKNGNIYYRDVDSPGTEYIAVENTHNSRPTWMRDGNHILYSHGQWSTVYENYVYNLHSVNVSNGTGASITRYLTPDISVRNSTENCGGGKAYILYNSSEGLYYILSWPSDSEYATWSMQINDISYNADGDSMFFCARDIGGDYEIYRTRLSHGGIIRVTDNSYNIPDLDCGYYMPDYRILNIHPPLFAEREFLDSRVDSGYRHCKWGYFNDPYKPPMDMITFQLLGDNYIPSSLVITIHKVGNASTLDTLESGVAFSTLSVNEYMVSIGLAYYTYEIDEFNRTFMVDAHIEYLDGEDTMSIDSSWVYVYNPFPSPIDSAMSATKEYAKRMKDKLHIAEEGKERCRIAGQVESFMGLFIMPLIGADISGFVSSGIENAVWTSGAGDVAGKVLGIPTGFNGLLLNNFEKAFDEASMHCRIRAEILWSDPPDSNYSVLPSWNGDTDTSIHPETDDSMAIKIYIAAKMMSHHGDLISLLTSSFEKFLWAGYDENQNYTVMQAKAMKKVADRLRGNSAKLDTIITWIADSLRGSELDQNIDVAILDSVKRRITSYGLSTTEHEEMLEAGMTEEQILEVIDSIFALDTSELFDCYLSDIYDSVRVIFTEGVAKFDSLVMGAQATIDSLIMAEVAVDSFPDACAGGPYQCIHGENVSIDASASSDPNGLALDYNWDTDGDGEFDDASGVSIEYNGVQRGIFTLALKIQNTAGYVGYDYAYVFVAGVDSMPVITNSEPETTFFVVEGDTTINFLVSAYDIGAKSPIEYSWLLDSVEVSIDSFLNQYFSAMDTGLHHVQVTISDGNPQSFDARKDWFIRVGDIEITTDLSFSINNADSIIMQFDAWNRGEYIKNPLDDSIVVKNIGNTPIDLALMLNGCDSTYFTYADSSCYGCFSIWAQFSDLPTQPDSITFDSIENMLFPDSLIYSDSMYLGDDGWNIVPGERDYLWFMIRTPEYFPQD
ncbi:hypothetical protein DRQ33_06385, partial [bacterium]